MNQLLKYSLSLIVIIMLAGCEKDEPGVVIDDRLQVYFDRFAEEGAARGITVDYDLIEISGKIEDIPGGSRVAGQCQSNSAEANLVIIDLSFWKNSNDITREFVIFHELGHCFLDRDHLDDADDDGNCVSIMHSGIGDCTDTFTHSTRSAFLDELFNP